MKAVEALRIENQKLKKDLAAKIKQLERTNEELNRRSHEIIHVTSKMIGLEKEFDMLKLLSQQYGFCNPDLQVGRLTFEEATNRWENQTDQGEAK